MASAESGIEGAPAEPRVVARHRIATLAVATGIVAATTALSWMMRDVVNDDAYITYRYAQNLSAGRGFVFNPGEAVLGTTAPLHGLLLAAFGALRLDVPSAALGLSWGATVVMAFLAYRMLALRGAALGGVVAAVFLIFAHKTYSVFPLETPLLGACQMAALFCAERGRSRLMAVALALAVLVRADSVLLAAALMTVLAWTGTPKRALAEAAGVATLVALPWFAFSWFEYGSLLSNTASTKTGWPGHLWMFIDSLWERGLGATLSDPWLSALAVTLAAYGALVTFRDESWARLRAVTLWALAQVAAYTALRIFWPHSWYYYPLHIGVCLLLGVACDHGLRALRARAKARFGTDTISRLLGAGFALLVVALAALQVEHVHDQARRIPFAFFAGGRDALYGSAAAWLKTHPTACARIAALEVGTLAYHSDRTMIDRMGLVSPVAGAEMKRTNQRETSVSWTARSYDVDCFVLTGSPKSRWPGVLEAAPNYRLVQTFTHGASQSLLAIYSR